MQIDSELLGRLTTNQIRILSVLIDSPDGVLSKDLARMSAVSNKSATITPEMKQALYDHGMEIIIARESGQNRQARWKIQRIADYIDPKEEMVDIMMTRELAEHLYKALTDSFNDDINCIRNE